MKMKVSAHFQLMGFAEAPEEITVALGIEPSVTHRAGDVLSARVSNVRHRQNSWLLDSGLTDSTDLEAHVRAVLRRLQTNWPGIVDLCARYESSIDCVIYLYDRQAPAIHFDQEIVRRLAELRSEIDVDLYVLVDESSA